MLLPLKGYGFPLLSPLPYPPQLYNRFSAFRNTGFLLASHCWVPFSQRSGLLSKLERLFITLNFKVLTVRVMFKGKLRSQVESPVFYFLLFLSYNWLVGLTIDKSKTVMCAMHQRACIQRACYHFYFLKKVGHKAGRRMAIRVPPPIIHFHIKSHLWTCSPGQL